MGSIPGSETGPGEGHGNPLQNSYLENPMVRGAQQATVHGVTKEPDMTEWLNNNECLLKNARYHCWDGTATNLPNPAKWKQALPMAPSSPFTTAWLSHVPKLWTFMCLKHASSSVFLHVDRASQLPVKIHDAPALIELLLRNSYQATDYTFQVHLYLVAATWPDLSQWKMRRYAFPFKVFTTQHVSMLSSACCQLHAKAEKGLRSWLSCVMERTWVSGSLP